MVYFNFCSFGSTGWQSTAHQQPKPQPAEHQPADPRDDSSQRPHRLHHRQGRHQDRWDQVVFLNLLNYLCVIVSWPSLVQTIVNRPTLVWEQFVSDLCFGSVRLILHPKGLVRFRVLCDGSVRGWVRFSVNGPGKVRVWFDYKIWSTTTPNKKFALEQKQ